MFVILTVAGGREDDVLDFLAGLTDLTKSVAFRTQSVGDDLINLVGIGSDLWDRLFSAEVPKPAGLHPFRALRGSKHTAPSTPGDLLIHLRAESKQACFEMMRIMLRELGSAVRIEDEVEGFRYFDNRDLLGFVDGTANPDIGDPAEQVVSIGDEDPGYAGGSYVIVQKYTHDMTAWEELSTEEQEHVIGRTKLDDIEYGDDTQPTNSHVAVNTVLDDSGEEREIYRLNQPFGSFSDQEFGTYFIGYAGDVSITEQMLENMFLGTDGADYDRILDFSTAETGSLYFVPTADWLEGAADLPRAGAEGTEQAWAGAEDADHATTDDVQTEQTDREAEQAGQGQQAKQASPADGSLGIGSLRN